MTPCKEDMLLPVLVPASTSDHIPQADSLIVPKLLAEFGEVSRVLT